MHPTHWLISTEGPSPSLVRDASQLIFGVRPLPKSKLSNEVFEGVSSMGAPSPMSSMVYVSRRPARAGLAAPRRRFRFCRAGVRGRRRLGSVRRAPRPPRFDAFRGSASALTGARRKLSLAASPRCVATTPDPPGVERYRSAPTSESQSPQLFVRNCKLDRDATKRLLCRERLFAVPTNPWRREQGVRNELAARGTSIGSALLARPKSVCRAAAAAAGLPAGTE